MKSGDDWHCSVVLGSWHTFAYGCVINLFGWTASLEGNPFLFFLIINVTGSPVAKSIRQGQDRSSGWRTPRGMEMSFRPADLDDAYTKRRSLFSVSRGICEGFRRRGIQEHLGKFHRQGHMSHHR